MVTGSIPVETATWSLRLMARTSGLHPGNASSTLTEITTLPFSPVAGRRILIPETLVRSQQGPPWFVGITAIISDCLSEDAGSTPARIAIRSSRLKARIPDSQSGDASSSLAKITIMRS